MPLDASPGDALRARVRDAIRAEVKTLQKELAQARASSAAARENLRVEREKAAALRDLVQQLRTELGEALAGQQVPTDRLDAALDLHGKLLAVLPPEHARLADEIAHPLLQAIAPWIWGGEARAKRLMTLRYQVGPK